MEETSKLDVSMGPVTIKIDGDDVAFHRDAHLKYIAGLAAKLDKPSSYEGAVTEHLRMSGIYWTYAGLSPCQSFRGRQNFGRYVVSFR